MASSNQPVPIDDTPEARVVREISRHYEALFRYIFSLVANEADTRDILQETCVDLHRRAARYDPQRPFLPWAFRFAYHEVLRHRTRARRSGLVLDPDVVELLASSRADLEPELEDRFQALDRCLAGLPERDRRLVDARYFRPGPIESRLRELGISRRTLFRHLDRIRLTLMDCINRRLSQDPGIAR
jgi:RNA polymerase sigma-70 factor (ECF subfamily)